MNTSVNFVAHRGSSVGSETRIGEDKADLSVRFFAPNPGPVPPAGAGEIDGVKLPAGRRYPRRAPAYWASIARDSDLDRMVPRLTSQFPSTGLWPLLWRVLDDPHAYLGGHGDLGAVDAVDPIAALRELWSQQRDPAAGDPFSGFQSLAEGSARTPDALADPHAGGLDPARLLLVPCHRPADAITVLGGLAVEIKAPVISCILRSWEQRFAAILIEVAPTALTLAVGAPPRSRPQATALAAELYALCARTNAGLTVRAIADDLLHPAGRSGGTPGLEISPGSWAISWQR